MRRIIMAWGLESMGAPNSHYDSEITEAVGSEEIKL